MTSWVSTVRLTFHGTAALALIKSFDENETKVFKVVFMHATVEPHAHKPHSQVYLVWASCVFFFVVGFFLFFYEGVVGKELVNRLGEKGIDVKMHLKITRVVKSCS